VVRRPNSKHVIEICVRRTAEELFLQKHRKIVPRQQSKEIYERKIVHNKNKSTIVWKTDYKRLISLQYKENHVL